MRHVVADDARCSCGLIALTGWWYQRLPTGFLPTEDQGYAIIGVQLPDAASQTRTRAVIDQVNEHPREDARRQDWFQIGGLSLLDQAVASNAGSHVRHLHALGRARSATGPQPGRRSSAT